MLGETSRRPGTSRSRAATPGPANRSRSCETAAVRPAARLHGVTARYFHWHASFRALPRRRFRSPPGLPPKKPDPSAGEPASEPGDSSRRPTTGFRAAWTARPPPPKRRRPGCPPITFPVQEQDSCRVRATGEPIVVPQRPETALAEAATIPDGVDREPRPPEPDQAETVTVPFGVGEDLVSARLTRPKPDSPPADSARGLVLRERIRPEGLLCTRRTRPVAESIPPGSAEAAPGRGLAIPPRGPGSAWRGTPLT